MTQEERRQKMPQCTAFIDSMRKSFGADQVVYINAKENGLSVEWGEDVVGRGVEIIPGHKSVSVHLAGGANRRLP